MIQIPLPLQHLAEPPQIASRSQLVRNYASDGATPYENRVNLELQYAHLIEITTEFNRQLVSYQANKNAGFHNWLRYKEGFSAELVKVLLEKFGVSAGQQVLDPFAGSATTLLVAQSKGISATGIDIMPFCHLMWRTKSRYQQYDLQTLHRISREVHALTPWNEAKFPHVPITQSAFDDEQERRLMGYKAYFDNLNVDDLTRDLLQLVLLSVLEDISFTRKDGQYLRWDSRSQKAQQRDTRRITQDKPAYKTFHKGKILDVTQAVPEALDHVIRDIEAVQDLPVLQSNQEMLEGTVLEILPQMESSQFDAVITSPPYCNRYDYTRTYALELAFLGFSHKEIVELRQDQLSCTVENRSKLDHLEAFYTRIGRETEFHTVVDVIENNAALQEIFEALAIRNARGDLNNKGVIQMVKGYFTELAFVIYELYRVCKPGAAVAIVNDNVRYGGEIIPVDLLMTDLATSFGFIPNRIYTLQQRKGNSSQQMGKYGREALRKSIIVWEKPNPSI